jgi:hypothetical protein
VLAGEHEVAVAAVDHLSVFRPGLTEYFAKRTMPPERPEDWAVAAPWTMLQEFALNLEFVEETHYQDPTRVGDLPSLILKTYPGPAFRLALPTLQARTIVAAVQAASTFTWDEFSVPVLKLLTDPTYPLPYQARVVSLGEQLAKRGL